MATPPRAAPHPWLFRLASATLLPLLLLALLEAGLRLLGFGAPAAFTLPCQVQGRKAFCENPAFSDPFFPPGLARRPTSFVIPADKSPGTRRIFIIGESAALGDPEPTFGLSRFLEAMLRERYPGAGFEVINTGLVAVNSHVLLPLVRDVARLQPDLFLFYAGNNEVVGPFGNGTVLAQRLPGRALIRASIFLRSTRLGQLVAALAQLPARRARKEWGGMEMFLDRQVRADDPSMAAVYQSFEANLHDMLEAARASGARVLVSTVGTRLRGFAPFASLHRPGADPAPWSVHFEAGKRLEAEGRNGQAQAEYLAAAAIDPDYAELQYRLGRSDLALGDAADARERLVKARDLDTLRFRADSRIDAILRRAAGADLVDGAAALDAGSPQGLPGDELFYEHAHLTPEGNYLLARAFLAPVAAALGLPRAEPPAEADCLRRLALTGFDRYRVAKEVLRRLSRPPFAGQLDHREQVAGLERARDREAKEEFEQSDAAYRAAIAERGADPWLHINYGILLDTRDVFLARHGQPDAGRAVAQYQQALELLPQTVPARFRLAEALLRLGRADEAIAQSRQILEASAGYAPAWQTIGRAFAGKKQLDDSRAAYERALALDPASLDARLELAKVRLMQNAPDAAEEQVRAAIALRPEEPQPHWMLVNLLEARGRPGDAARSAELAATAVGQAGRPEEAAAFAAKARELAQKK